MTDLHITNGDGAANIIKAGTVAGDVLPWRDPMHHGPFPADLDLAQLGQIRGRYLTGPGTDSSEAERDFRLRDEHLRAAANYDRVILWFEHDLLDQLQILQLLDWFAQTDLGGTRLEMICIGAFPGIDPFRGIGQLDTGQMTSLIEHRQPVTAAQLNLAKAGWGSFRSSNPLDLESFVAGDLRHLPFLHAALTRHLEEYPSSQTGLTRTEHQILTLVADGVSDPGRIFVENMELETAYFIGDWPTYRHISDLCAGHDPLLHSDGEPYWYPPQTQCGREAFRSQRLRLSKTGEQVLAGQRDAFGVLKRDWWLGGVHLQTDAPIWTWDAKSKSLKLRDS